MKFSVLIPIYHKNIPAELSLTLKSVWEDQLRKPDEIVIVEDGLASSEMEEVIAEHAAHAPIRLLRLPKNVGLGAALREGVTFCSHECIARMDGDDVALPERFENQISFLEQHPEISIVGCMIEEFVGDPRNVYGRRMLPERHEDIAKFIKIRNPFNHMTVCFRKQAILDAGNYELLVGMEDYWLWARCLARGCKVANLPDVLVRARAGANMIGRRRGWKIFRSEIFFAQKLVSIGILNRAEMVKTIAIRGCGVLLPVFVLRKIYSSVLRKKVSLQ